MTEKEITQISKTLSYVLRHKPEEIGIILDENGYVPVNELITQFNAYHKIQLTLEKLRQVVTENDKQRFAFNEDETYIRANQGHSIEINLGYQAQKPPDFLYHGTAVKNLASIRKTGLEKRNRHHVHLSADTETATKVGQRYGVPVILVVKSLEMHQNGFEFFKSDNEVWLTDMVKVTYIDFPDY
ncbi:MAG: RNA 2'-phosphotransferase [Verrucomicrobia bacterium]|nr:RNA 2'-phosphotransferase [Cytophagales bacterium]